LVSKFKQSTLLFTKGASMTSPKPQFSVIFPLFIMVYASGCDGLKSFNRDDHVRTVRTNPASSIASDDMQKDSSPLSNTPSQSVAPGEPPVTPLPEATAALPTPLEPETNVMPDPPEPEQTPQAEGPPSLPPPTEPPAAPQTEQSCLTATLPELAHAATAGNMSTILRTLTTHTLSGTDGAFDTFPLIDTESKFEKWIAQNVTVMAGLDMPYLDSWCHRFGRYVAYPDRYVFEFASAGQDGKFNTPDDIVMVWDGFNL
jgi:hypothetical protein